MIHVIEIDDKALREEAADAGLSLDQLQAVNHNLDIWSSWSERERGISAKIDGNFPESRANFDQTADKEERRVSDITELCVSELPNTENSAVREHYLNKVAGAQVFRFRGAPRSPEQRRFVLAQAKSLLFTAMRKRNIIHLPVSRPAQNAKIYTLRPGTVRKLRPI